MCFVCEEGDEERWRSGKRKSHEREGVRVIYKVRKARETHKGANE